MQTLQLVKTSDMTCNIQSECFIQSKVNSSSLKFVYDIDSRNEMTQSLCFIVPSRIE